MITFDETTITVLKEKAKGNKIRFEITSGGCSGFSYKLNIDEQAEDDKLIEDFILVDENTYDMLEDLELKYIDDFSGSYFTLVSKDIKSKCGCGVSFSL